MAQGMNASLLRYSGLPFNVLQKFLNAPAAVFSSQLSLEYKFLRLVNFVVFPHDGKKLFTQHHYPVLSSLRLPDVYYHTLRINICDLQ